MSVDFPIAYIDPVSGSILLQVILAALVGTAAFFRRSILRLVSFGFLRGDKKDDESDEGTAE